MEHCRFADTRIQRLVLDVEAVCTALLAGRFMAICSAVAMAAWMEQLRDIVHVKILNGVSFHEQFPLERLPHLARRPATHPRGTGGQRETVACAGLLPALMFDDGLKPQGCVLLVGVEYPLCVVKQRSYQTFPLFLLPLSGWSVCCFCRSLIVLNVFGKVVPIVFAERDEFVVIDRQNEPSHPSVPRIAA